MSSAKSRRALYSEATRAALLDAAEELFAERGFAATSLDDIATATQVTRGAVYHHFDGKQALFEAVLERVEKAMVERVVAAVAGHTDPWGTAAAAIDAFLDQCCDPVYGRLCWLEGPLALGWQEWMQFEAVHGYAIVEQFVRSTKSAGLMAGPVAAISQLVFHLLGGAGRMIAEAPPDTKQDVRDSCSELVKRMISGLRP